MTSELDPRAWNLFVGLALVAGCGSRTISSDDDETSDGASTGPDECMFTSDCPLGYECYEPGVCMYSGQDGYIPDGYDPDDGYYFECYSDSECGTLELCNDYSCVYVETPPPCGGMATQTVPLDVSEPVLALAFVDLDDDGAHELVIATDTQLHTHETGAPMPVSQPHGIAPATIDAVVGGWFDDIPGQDVLLLHDSLLHLYSSDGMGGFASVLEVAHSFPDALGLEAGAFDMFPTTDLLIWGTGTTGIRYNNGQDFDIFSGPVSSADSRELGLPGNGFSLLQDSEILLVDIGGFIMGSVFLYGTPPRTQASLDNVGISYELGASKVTDWTLVELFERTSAQLSNRWGVPGEVTHMRTGDFDGLDETDEIAMIVDGNLSLYVTCLIPAPLDGQAMALAFGDHDGDGDDELAVATAANTVSIVDVE